MKLRFLSIFLVPILFESCVTQSGHSDPIIHRTAAYSVEDGNLVLEEPDEEDGSDFSDLSEHRQALHRSIWARVRALVPDQYEQYIHRFVIESDGPAETAAYVEAAEGENSLDLSSWTLSMDIVDSIDHTGNFRDEDMDKAIIHEFAHILSLNSSEADPADYNDMEDLSWRDTWDFSEQYREAGSILRKDSYLNLFFLEFWGAERIQQWFNMESLNQDEYFLDMLEISVQYHTDFVSDYAMTNPSEDFAESFTSFVLRDEIPEKDLGSHRKVRFFYDFPEVAEMRNEIRAALPEQYSNSSIH